MLHAWSDRQSSRHKKEIETSEKADGVLLTNNIRLTVKADAERLKQQPDLQVEK